VTGIDGQRAPQLVSYHELDALLQLTVVMIPTEGGRGIGNDSVIELGTLTFIGKCTVWFNYESRSGLSSIYKTIETKKREAKKHSFEMG